MTAPGQCRATFAGSGGVESCELPHGHNRAPAMRCGDDAFHVSEGGIHWTDGGASAITDADGGQIEHDAGQGGLTIGQAFGPSYSNPEKGAMR